MLQFLVKVGIHLKIQIFLIIQARFQIQLKFSNKPIKSDETSTHENPTKSHVKFSWKNCRDFPLCDQLFFFGGGGGGGKKCFFEFSEKISKFFSTYCIDFFGKFEKKFLLKKTRELQGKEIPPLFFSRKMRHDLSLGFDITSRRGTYWQRFR